ncbi:MAG TPA: nucleotidyltransferase family protein [Gemmatimonadaceae bacterium]|nr:nucleotidyltransferase family protein [Gemmatimonadaceae bacterium]
MPDPATILAALDEDPDAPLDELRRREDAWHSTHRAEALWPGLDAARIQAAADAIGAAVAGVLRGERTRLGIPSDDIDDERAVRALSVAGLLTGVGPLLGAWLERGELAADAPVARAFARHLAHGRAREARIRAAVMPVLEAMARAGLEPGVIKGFHTAHGCFPEPGARPFADVDVVVASEVIPRCEELLREAGFLADARLGRTSYKREWHPPDGRGRVWSFELWHARSGWKLDLHDGLNFAEVLQNVRTPQIARLTERVSINDVTLRAPHPNESIALIAAHGSTELYSQRLLRLTELVLVTRRAAARGALDWTAVEASLAERESLRFAYPMLVLADRLAPGTVDAALLARLRRASTWRALAVTDALTPTAPVLDTQFSLRRRLMWAAGVRATARRLWRMVAPLEGADARGRLRTYRHRVIRLLSLALPSRFRRADRGDG